MADTSNIPWQAERTFDCVAPDGSKSLIHAAIGFPKQVGDTDEWQCPYRFAFLKHDRVRYISGSGALQSLLCALAILMVEVRTLQKPSRYKVTYQGSTDLLHALPHVRFSKKKKSKTKKKQKKKQK